MHERLNIGEIASGLEREYGNHADVSRTLGLTQDAFEREWLAFVRGRYGI